MGKLLVGDLNLQSDVLSSDDYMWLQTVVGSRVITMPPALSFAFGRSKNVPYAMSTNRIELPVPGGKSQIGKPMQIAFCTDTAAAARSSLTTAISEEEHACLEKGTLNELKFVSGNLYGDVLPDNVLSERGQRCRSGRGPDHVPSRKRLLRRRHGDRFNLAHAE